MRRALDVLEVVGVGVRVRVCVFGGANPNCTSLGGGIRRSFVGESATFARETTYHCSHEADVALAILVRGGLACLALACPLVREVAALHRQRHRFAAILALLVQAREFREKAIDLQAHAHRAAPVNGDPPTMRCALRSDANTLLAATAGETSIA